MGLAWGTCEVDVVFFRCERCGALEQVLTFRSVHERGVYMKGSLRRYMREDVCRGFLTMVSGGQTLENSVCGENIIRYSRKSFDNAPTFCVKY